jgi:hypothetical protein
MNTNDYDGDAFTDASVKFHDAVLGPLEALWKAGGSAKDIIDEINNALAEAGINSSMSHRPLELSELI